MLAVLMIVRWLPPHYMVQNDTQRHRAARATCRIVSISNDSKG